MTYRVDIIESEAGWGKTIDESLDFLTHDAAKKWVDKYNKKHNPPMDATPNWYMYAGEPYEVR